MRLLFALTVVALAVAGCRDPLCVHTLSATCSCDDGTSCVSVVDEVYCSDDASARGADASFSSGGTVVGRHDPCVVQNCCYRPDLLASDASPPPSFDLFGADGPPPPVDAALDEATATDGATDAAAPADLAPTVDAGLPLDGGGAG